MRAMPGQHRPFRFGVQIGAATSAAEWRSKAERAEALGYDILLIADHIGLELFAYAPALAAAAAATRQLRLGTHVLANDFRHPVLVAREAATLDLLSDGRFELGLGAGWDRSDFERSGLAFDPPGTRVARLQESVALIKQLLEGEPVTLHGRHYQVSELQIYPRPVQRPHPPLMIGAGSPRMLALAAQEADIIALIPPALPEGGLSLAIEADAMDLQVARIRDAAGERLAEVELNLLLQRLVITSDREAAARATAEEWMAALGGARTFTAESVLDSPYLLFGTTEEIVATLQQRRNRFGISYLTVFERYMEDFAPVVGMLDRR